MKLRDFFLLGLSQGMGKKRHWMNSLFAIVYNPPKEQQYPYQVHIQDQQMYFHDPFTNAIVELDDYVPERAPLHFRDEFILKPGEIKNYKGTEPVRTTYGNVFANYMCLVLPFGDIFDFQVGVFTPGVVEKRILDILIDDRADGDITTPAPEGKAHVWQYLMFAEHALALPAYADMLVTSITKKSMTAHPDRNKIRTAWMEANPDRLTDPAAIAELEVILRKLDDEYLGDDESVGFYRSKGKLAGARKKVHYMFGAESAFSDGTKVEFIPKSLEEGLTMDKLPVMNNSLRFGSYNRGAQTALGGESTKTIYRMVGTVRIIEPDCQSHIGIPTWVHAFNVDTLLGYSYVEDNKSVLITNANAPGLIGKIIDVRGPMACKSGRDLVKGVLGKGKNICAVCAGKNLAENPNGIPAAAAGVGGKFLSLFLSKMHATVLRTVNWDMYTRIT